MRQPVGTIEIEQRYTSGVYPKRPLALVRGEGARVWDEAGREYLDFTSGQGVATLGHCHPAVQTALVAQSQRLLTCPEIFYNDQRAALLERLAERMPTGLTRFFLCNSGAEAVEAALKFARLSTGRAGIVATKRGFHGRTLGALSATWEPRYRQPFEPLLPGVRHVPFNDAAAMAETIGPDTAAVLVEIVQGEGGVRLGSPAYFRELRRLCTGRGALLIVDEVQTGLGRTGRWLACDHVGLVPDLLCLGKALGGGLPMGAVALGPRVAPLPSGSHGSTFGGNPLACAAALAALDACEREGLVARAAAVGERLLGALQVLRSPVVREVRGLGAMVGIELTQRVTPLLQALMARGLLALPAGPTVLRLLPPLVVSDEQVEQAVAVIAATLAEVALAEVAAP